jgi:rod shape determining protein RodA
MIPRIHKRTWLFDTPQLLAVAGLVLLGTVFVYSATMVSEPVGFWQQYHENTLVDFMGWLVRQLFFRQIVWYALGIGAAALVCWVDYHTLARWSLVAYWVSTLALVLVLFFGTVRFGARRWFDLGFFSLQPSEFAKLTFILAMAHFLSRPLEELKSPRVFWRAIGLLALPFVLIMKEPDLGSALVLLPTCAVMLWRACRGAT